MKFNNFSYAPPVSGSIVIPRASSYWNFNHGFHKAPDLGLNNYIIDKNGSPVVGQGRYGWDVDFSGSEYYSNSNAYNFNVKTDPFTILTVCMADSSSGNRNVVSNKTGAVGFRLTNRSSNRQWDWVMAGSSGIIAIRSTVVATLNKWHVVVVSYDGTDSSSGQRFFQDGIEDSNHLTSSSMASSSPSGGIEIGSELDGANAWLGKIAICAVWDRALTTNEIKAVSYDPYLPIRSRKIRRYGLVVAPAGGLSPIYYQKFLQGA